MKHNIIYQRSGLYGFMLTLCCILCKVNYANSFVEMCKLQSTVIILPSLGSYNFKCYSFLPKDLHTSTSYWYQTCIHFRTFIWAMCQLLYNCRVCRDKL